jgi:hypothetical protein
LNYQHGKLALADQADFGVLYDAVDRHRGPDGLA